MNTDKPQTQFTNRQAFLLMALWFIVGVITGVILA